MCVVCTLIREGKGDKKKFKANFEIKSKFEMKKQKTQKGKERSQFDLQERNL